MSTPAFRTHAFFPVAALFAIVASALPSQPAHAWDVKVSSIAVTDAETGSATKLVVGRKLSVQCDYEYSLGPLSAAQTPWQIQLQTDGQAIGTYAAELPPPNLSPFYAATTVRSVQAFTTPSKVGQHLARCVLDPGGQLKAFDTDQANNSMSVTFMVDVVPHIGIGQAQPGPSTAKPSGFVVPPQPKGPAPGAAGPVAQVPAPVLADPALKLALKASILPNCGQGQDVIAISGAVNNVGSGFAVIPPGKPAIKIDAPVGVWGASITIGNIAPGQSVPVSANLKPKAPPASLAGATLKLDASVSAAIKQSSSWGNQQSLTVVFPANFCKTPQITTGRPISGK